MTGNRQRYTTSRFSSSSELLFNSLLDYSLHALSSVFVPFHFSIFSILSFSPLFSPPLPLPLSLSSPLLPLEPAAAAAHSFRYFLSSRKRARKDESDMPPLPLLYSRFLPSLWALTFILFAHRSLSTFSHFRILTLPPPPTPSSPSRRS